MVEDVFLTLLDRFTAEGRHVFESKHATIFAPKAFAKRPDAEGYTTRDFDAAMGRLFAAGKIRAEVYGRPGDTRQHIVRIVPEKAA